MRFLYKLTDDLDVYAEDPAVTAVGHVLEALLSGERDTMPNLAHRFEQQCFGHIMASGIRNRSHPPGRTG